MTLLFTVFDLSRYDVCICLHNNIEPVASGPLEPLLLHSHEIRSLHSKGCDAKYKLEAPESLNSSKWFTKSTLVRCIVASVFFYSSA